MGRLQNVFFLLVCLCFAVPAASAAAGPVAAASGSPHGAAGGDRPAATYAVASAHPLATKAGVEILQAGGNAFDAAVAVSAMLSVVEPYSSGVGGGGFWLLHRAADGFETMVDGRETAPAAASATMYQDKQGRAIADLSRNGAIAGGIPGEPAALDWIAGHYGKLGLARDLAPAIRVARQGFDIDSHFAEFVASEQARLSPAARAVYMPGGKLPKTGTRIRQPDLANTLQRFADGGRDGFYGGETARRLVAGVRADGGIWTLADLQHYRALERKPVSFYFRDYHVVSVPPPSAGGIGLAEMLQQLEVLGWTGDDGLLSQQQVIESMRRAYRDRAAWLGDADFVDVPQRWLLSRTHAIALARSFVPDRATPSATLPTLPDAPQRPAREGPETSHFSIIDAAGNRVAATVTVNLRFGSGYMAPGTGVIVNDEMDDFAASVTASNAYGLIGSRANEIAPGKRPLSSMSPAFVDGPRGSLVIGTPGGSRIITMVLLGILDFVHGDSAQQIVAAPRYHHQYLPDVVQFEPGAFDAAAQQRLRAMGYALEPLSHRYGNMEVVMRTADGTTTAAADPRGVGTAQVGPSSTP
jgi:gamma-glutamyltranspeptidase/glutathione hydrolase